MASKVSWGELWGVSLHMVWLTWRSAMCARSLELAWSKRSLPYAAMTWPSCKPSPVAAALSGNQDKLAKSTSADKHGANVGM